MSSGLEVDHDTAFNGVNKCVMQALSELKPVRARNTLDRKPLESYLSQLYATTLSNDRDAMAATVGDMRRARISSAQIAESYVPEVARRLGEAWVADTLDFGRVTIGCARLQGLLWKLENDWMATARSPGDGAPAFLVGVVAGHQHTLGATVLAGQLRRRGMSVNLDLELTPKGMLDHVINQQLSGVLISVAACHDLASVCELVDISRYQSRDTPVIIGGGILDLADNIKSQTGADLVTSSVDDVMWFCDTRRLAREDPFAIAQDVT